MLIALSLLSLLITTLYGFAIYDEIKYKRGGAAPLTFIWVGFVAAIWVMLGWTLPTEVIKYSEWAQVSKGADYVVIHHSDFSTTLKDAKNYNRFHDEEWVEIDCEYNVNIYGGLVSIERKVK
jgi:hypothetical protein